MAHFRYCELLEASSGRSLTEERSFDETWGKAAVSLCTDTRSLQPGDFFVPLSGERFDGHAYLELAFEKGASGAFVQAERLAQQPEWAKFPNLIGVENPVQAYLDVARLHRRRSKAKIIAVTGSSGKTTTKEMLFAALSPLLKTQKTAKNFNNEVGVAQTLLALEPETELLIVEMGMRGPGQIAQLSRAAEPDIALIVSIGPAHIEFLGSVENIARAKLEIAAGLHPVSGILVLNADSPYLADLATELWTGKTVLYRVADAARLPLPETMPNVMSAFRAEGECFTLSVAGDHMIANALGVLQVGRALGFGPHALAVGLASFQPEQGRGEKQALPAFSNVWVINDAYNANPDSAKASILAFLEAQTQANAQALAQGKALPRLILLLGGMKELGAASESYHCAFGAWLAEQEQLSLVILVGAEAPWLLAGMQKNKLLFPVWMVDDVTAAAQCLLAEATLLHDSILYLKGSRAYQLDRLPALLQTGQQPVTLDSVSRV